MEAPLALLDLPDELIDAVVIAANESIAFFAVTCRRIMQSEKNTRISQKRRCAIESAFYTRATLDYALHNTSFINLVRSEFPTGSTKWTKPAIVAALKCGSPEVAALIVPNLTKTKNSCAVGLLARYDRIDLLQDNACAQWIQHQVQNVMQHSAKSVVHPTSAARPFVTCFVVPCLMGASKRTLQSCFQFAFANGRDYSTARYRGSVWAASLNVRPFSLIPHALVAASATSHDAAFSFEFVCTSLAMARPKLNATTIRRHVAAATMCMLDIGISASAMEWARKQSFPMSLHQLLQHVNHDISVGVVVLALPQHPLTIGTSVLTPRNLQTYKFVHRETRPGGWMCDALPNDGAVEHSLLVELWMQKDETKRDHSADDLRMAMLATQRCIQDNVTAGSPRYITALQLLRQLSEASVEAAYSVAYSLTDPSRAYTRMYRPGIFNLLYGDGAALHSLLIRSMALRKIGVIKALLSPRGMDLARDLTVSQREQVANGACFADSYKMTAVLLDNDAFEPTLCGTLQATKMRRSGFLQAVLARHPNLACEDVGRAACETQNSHIIGVAIAAHCFVEGSALEARLRLRQHCTTKRRTLPHSFFSMEKWLERRFNH